MVFDNKESVIHMETGRVVTILVYPRCGMVNMMCIRILNIRNDINHKETSCGMDHTISKLHRKVVYK